MRRSSWAASILAGVASLSACQRAAAPANVAAVANTPAAASNAATRATPPAAAAATDDAADAKAFVEGLYKHYQAGATTSTWAPFDDDAPKALDPELVALFRAYDKAMDGEVGDIEDDWICQCQEWEKINATVTVDSATATTAKVRSTFQDTADHVGPRHDTFDLVKTPAGWRIHDMGADGDRSLRAVLIKATAQARAHPQPPDADANATP